MVHWESGTQPTGFCVVFRLCVRFAHSRATPTLVRGDLSSLAVVGMSGGTSHSLFVVSDGRVFSTGGHSTNLGLLGVGDSVNRCNGISPPVGLDIGFRVTPTLVLSLFSISVVKVAAGYSHSLVLGTIHLPCVAVCKLGLGSKCLIFLRGMEG